MNRTLDGPEKLRAIDDYQGKDEQHGWWPTFSFCKIGQHFHTPVFPNFTLFHHILGATATFYPAPWDYDLRVRFHLFGICGFNETKG